MFLGEEKRKTKNIRTSKLGKKHHIIRTKTYYKFKCDSCNVLFERERGAVAAKRISNYYKHVCNKCNQKKFAQAQGVKQRKLLDMDVSSTRPIGEL